MRAAWLWARTDLRRRWAGVVFLTALAGLCGAVVLTAVSGARRTASAFDRATESLDVHDAMIQLSEPGADRVAQLPFVERVVGVEQYVGQVDGSEADFGLASMPPQIGREYGRGFVSEGRLPSPGHADEVALTSAAAEELAVGVGDTITFRALAPRQLAAFIGGNEGYTGDPGPVIPLRVVGIGDGLDDRISESGAFGYVSAAFGRRHSFTAGHFGGANGLGDLAFIWLEGGRDDLGRLATGVGELFRDQDEVGLTTTLESARKVDGAVGSLQTGALVVAVVAGIAGMVAITLVVQRHVARHRGDQQALAALGFDRRAGVGAVFLALSPLIAGAPVVAIAGAVAASELTPFGLARGIETGGPFWFDWPVLTVGAAVVAIGTATAVLIAAWNVSSTRARRPRAAYLPTTGLVGAPALGTGVRFALRRDGRTPVMPTLAAAVLGTAGVVGAAAFASNLDELSREPVAWGWTWDFQLDIVASRSEGTLQRLVDEPSVASFAHVTTSQAEVNGFTVRAYAVDVRRGTFPMSIHAGRPPASPAEVALGRRTADDLGVGVGDEVRFATPSGPLTMTVVGEITQAPSDGEPLGSSVTVTPEGLSAVAQSDGYSVVRFVAAPGLDPEKVAGDLAARYENELFESVYSQSKAHEPADIRNASSVRMVPRVLAAFFAALTLAVVGHAIATSGHRRRGELSILRALGFRPVQVRRALLTQAATIAAVGLVVGLLPGLAAGRTTWQVQVRALGTTWPYAVPLATLAVGAVLALVAAGSVALAPSIRAARAQPIKLLRAE